MTRGADAIEKMGNQVSRNTAVGILLQGHANGNSVTGNVANANQGGPGHGGGVVILDSTANSVIGNTTNRNAAVGMGLYESTPGASSGNTLARNVATSNADHGIVAVPGTIDGGGNIAHLNTPRPDCVEIHCS